MVSERRFLSTCYWKPEKDAAAEVHVAFRQVLSPEGESL
jgi:hypothetical protein